MHPSHEPLPGAWSAPPGARPEPPGPGPQPGAGSEPRPDAGPLPGPWSAPPSGHSPADYPEPLHGGYPVPLQGGHPEPEPPPGAPEPGRWSPRNWRMQQSRRRPWRRTLTVTIAVIAAISALGVPFGLLWSWLAPEVPVVDIGDGVVVNDPAPEQYIAADGWFTLLGLGFGLLVAIAAWLILRRDRGPFLLLGVIIGTSLAAQRVAPFIGEMIGRDAYDQWRATAAQGATYLAPPEVHSFGPTLVPAFAAAIVLTLLAGWSNDPDLDQPGAQPGYAANHPDHPAPYHGYAYDPADYQRPPTPYDDGPVAIGGGDHTDPGPADPTRRTSDQ